MKNQNILLSIIIPMYNSQSYIQRCLDSIPLSDNIEVVIIDDGSTDDSLNLVSKYKESNNNRILLTRINHRGLSIARNVGISMAQGSYIAFLDSDDWIDSSTFPELLDNLFYKHPDVLITRIQCIPDFGYSRCFADPVLDSNRFENTIYGTIPNYLIDNRLKISPSVRYIVKRSIVESKNLRFHENMSNEDILWSTELLCYDLNFQYFAKPYYFYRLRSNSLSSLEDENYYKNLAHIIIEHYTLLYSNDNVLIKSFILKRITYYFSKITQDVQKSKISPVQMQQFLKTFSETVDYTLPF